MALVVGLTGGIGSGKSAAADEFARLGATVVDTDAISHELTGPGGAAIAEIKRLFGNAFIDADGAMNRKRMRDLVFSDAEEKLRLEALLHPMIRAESERRIEAAKGPMTTCRPRVPASSPLVTPNAGRSSATSTTARSSTSSRWR